ncbi:hypothetical protein SD71_11630 [Cohnella kolymensis]|uniref:DZANK-type domain-containing protein n=1 Tax=Cohnella kolymensis TaxID=1590652 RepID=A0ABR5A5D9_9BACL|nr:hypothetical protein [Cohnella kolymensis]KIL35978.1 hypothetical protein SD71_11630 [Cohnella kolymensis]
MAVTICPWCQSEVPHEEGEEPEKFCPVCDNEMDGYRTLRVNVGSEEEEEEQEEEEAEENDDSAIDWNSDVAMSEKDEALLRFEETVAEILDEQDLAPECPQCREYMLEAGEQLISGEQFRPRIPEALGQAVLEAPFALTVYMCPSCFTVQTTLAENDRHHVARRLSEASTRRTGGHP